MNWLDNLVKINGVLMKETVSHTRDLFSSLHKDNSSIAYGFITALVQRISSAMFGMINKDLQLHTQCL